MAKSKKSKSKKPKGKTKVRSKSKSKAKRKKRKSRKKPPTRPAFINLAPAQAPPDFTVNLGDAAGQDEAYAVILARLEDARARLPTDYDSRIIIHPYADGSVDGELYVRVPQDSRETEFDLYDAFTPLVVGRHYWITAGARYIIEKDDEIYRRFRGMNQVETNYQSAIRPNIVEVHNILRQDIIPGMANRFKREAHSVYIRLHWNPANERPKRAE